MPPTQRRFGALLLGATALTLGACTTYSAETGTITDKYDVTSLSYPCDDRTQCTPTLLVTEHLDIEYASDGREHTWAVSPAVHNECAVGDTISRTESGRITCENGA